MMKAGDPVTIHDHSAQTTSPTGNHTRSWRSSRVGMRSAVLGVLVNGCLAIVKGAAGYFGNSYALIADAIESTSDIFSSIVVYLGLRMAGRPADENHPYGHGKFEPVAALVVSLALMAAAILIGVESAEEIITPHHAPAPYTLAVLAIVIVVKETLFRYVIDVGEKVGSLAVKTDAWHHRSDAITSAAAFIGILIAVLGGKGYESADDFAALIAAGIIAINAVRLLRPAMAELLDTAPPKEVEEAVLRVATDVAGVKDAHQCRVRKVGFDLFVDLHVVVDPLLTVAEGHAIAHRVKDQLKLHDPAISDALIHIEPAG